MLMALAAGSIAAGPAVSGWTVPWPEGFPEALRYPAFSETTRRAIAACQPEGIELVGVDCSGPPCYAVLRARREEGGPSDNDLLRALVACPAWTEAFGGGYDRLTRHSAGFHCGDGRSEFAVLLGSSDALAAFGATTPEQLDLVKREGADRLAHWYAGWHCAPTPEDARRRGRR